jgi:hypothetical protein
MVVRSRHGKESELRDQRTLAHKTMEVDPSNEKNQLKVDEMEL